ncbi:MULTISPECIES: TolC family outer membrane protein [unclassified Pseudoalteromonas]|uniref:TolC family outer membrane protein n=2 Tax=Pseudoalteromonas TaxID=53246 RepID=UPI0015FDD47F|nr:MULTISPECIES: TolC family outer membrane protein [unclassified Pseudoalteromonas]MBB1354112.1 TolC family outer membrane protein [Pseudoalteromonas sp. SR45-5]MBB1307703.1 TolC family outer membrane protein [Pseudoalteromonas sp. SR43-5]MBB1324726.1 TolC family outer membrane protein [Pseudoalteromonas sp. SR45-1]MBB1346530.1 TolC family outer membrane protein [Pseudoalteromonas sp. SG45-2]MBB1352292.1 TolC family outer membrane protein [Pseudoalteromonas sp. SG45-3]
MITKNTFKKHQETMLIGLTITAATLLNYVHANEQSAMPLTYVSSKAIENNPEVQEAWHAFKSSIYGVDAARSGYLPSVDVSASAGYERRNYGVEEEYNRNTAELSVTQMLYDGFRTSNTVDRFKRIQLIRYFELISQTEQTALEASIALLDVQKFKELVQLAEANLQEHESVYQQIEQSVGAGVARAADLEQISGRLSLAQSNVLTEYSNLHDVSARYLRVVGELPMNDIKQADLDEKNIPISVNQALDVAYKNSPSFYASLYNIEAQKANAKAQKAAFHPNVDLSARYGSQDRDELGQNETRTEARVGIDISYNLYNGGLDNANLEQAYQDINIAKYQRDQSCIDIRQSLQIAYYNVTILEQKLPALDQHRESSTKVKIAYKDQFDIGQRTLLDVLDAENESFQSTRSYIVALYDRQSAILTMLKEMGKLLPALNVMSDKYPTLKELTDDPIVHNAQNICPSYDVATTFSRKAFLQKKAKQDNAYMSVTAMPRYLDIPLETDTTASSFTDDDGDGVPNEQDTCPSTPLSTNVDLSGCTIYSASTSNIEIGIPFSADSSDVRSQYIQEISRLADFLKENPTKQVEIQGHASLDGDRKYNRKLSEKRAFAVAEILIKQFDVEPKRVKSFGYGIDQPRVNEISVRANAANRRIEAVITDT